MQQVVNEIDALSKEQIELKLNLELGKKKKSEVLSSLSSNNPKELISEMATHCEGKKKTIN